MRYGFTIGVLTIIAIFMPDIYLPPNWRKSFRLVPQQFFTNQQILPLILEVEREISPKIRIFGSI